jgi:hypothetical protein
VKGVIFLLPILGLTWVFGVVAVNNTAVVFQYIFTIFNSFQVSHFVFTHRPPGYEGFLGIYCYNISQR